MIFKIGLETAAKSNARFYNSSASLFLGVFVVSERGFLYRITRGIQCRLN